MYVCTLYEFFFSLCFSVESVKKKEVHMEMEAVVCVQELHIVQCMYVCMYVYRKVRNFTSHNRRRAENQ